MPTPAAPIPAWPPLITAAELRQRLDDRAAGRDSADWRVCDCRFVLTDPSAGLRAHAAGRIPGALHVDLEHHLSEPGPASRGRHPLPPPEGVADRLAALGIGPDTRVVAYDDAGGAMAARLWWMLRWIGHAAVQVLDGGLPAWLAEGGALETGPLPPPAAAAAPPGRLSQGAGPSMPTVAYADLRSALGRPPRLVVDARAADRFRGENETLDPIAGHIPGAVNRFFKDNLQADGRFKPAAQLQAEWRALMAGRSPADLVQQCGSGVSACHNLLAMAVAGLEGAALYPGSWSEWVHQPDAVIATGA